MISWMNSCSTIFYFLTGISSTNQFIMAVIQELQACCNSFVLSWWFNVSKNIQRFTETPWTLGCMCGIRDMQAHILNTWWCYCDIFDIREAFAWQILKENSSNFIQHFHITSTTLSLGSSETKHIKRYTPTGPCPDSHLKSYRQKETQ